MTNQTIVYTPPASSAEPKPEESQFNPKEFATYLENEGLSKSHQIIKIAACFSNEFAKYLQLALTEQGYKDITVYGYYRSFIEPRDIHPNGLANLAGADILDEDGRLNDDIYVLDDINKYYDARLVRVCYGSEELVAANKAEREELRKAVGLKVEEFSEKSKPPLPENNFPIRRQDKVQASKKARAKPANTNFSLITSLHAQQSLTPSANSGRASASLMFSSQTNNHPTLSHSRLSVPSPEPSSPSSPKPQR